MSRFFHPLVRIRRAGAEGDEAGFTLVELVVGILILSIISAIVFTVITQMMTEGQAITDTVIGAQQSNRANESIVQYLRGITSFSGASQTANSLAANSNIGFNGANGTPDTDTLTATWTAGTGTKDATFQVTINCTSSCGSSGSANVYSEYYARPVVVNGQTKPTFTYYKDNGSGGLTALTAPVPPCAYAEIFAVGIQISFLAGPQRPTEGYFADQATTLITTIYLRNPTNPSSTTTSSTTSTTACSE